MDSEVIFRDALAAYDLESLKTVLQDDSYVDVESENFVQVVRLSISNGDEEAFAKLVGYIPDLHLKSRARAAVNPKTEAWYDSRAAFHRYPNKSFIGLNLSTLFFHQVFRSLMIYSASNTTGTIQTLSALAAVRLYSSAAPFYLWIKRRIFYGLKSRFSRKFFFDTLDDALVFLWLLIATRLISRRWWLGFYLHECLHSVDILGFHVRANLARITHDLRISCISIIFGADSLLAWPPRTKAPVSQIDHGYDILEQLLQSKCHEEALMIRFLEKTTFEDIKEDCGPGHEILIWAAINGSLEIVRKLFNLGIRIDKSRTGSRLFKFYAAPAGSALFWAATEGHSTVVEYLLRHGADPNHTVRPPLVGAVMGSSRSQDSEPYEQYISRYAACVSHLLEAGANPDSVDDDGRSALSWSTDSCVKPILDLLLNAGANANLKDKKLMLPIHYAAKSSGSEKVVEALVEKTTNLNAVDEKGLSALTWSLWSADCHPTIKLLADNVSDINSGGGIYGTPLQAASLYCSSSILRMLLEKGANPNLCGDNHESSLIVVLRHMDLEDDIVRLKLLLSHGADPNVGASDGEPALHIAAERLDDAEIIELLLKHGADMEVVHHYADYGIDIGTTPLGASCCLGVNENSAMALLKAGANPNCMTPVGETALQAACRSDGSSKLAKELIAKGADIAVQSVRHDDTALHAAATAARSDIIKVLLEKGADANAKNAKLKTPLHEVCWMKLDNEPLQEEEENHFEAWRRFYEQKKQKNLVESIKLLLTRGQANPKAQDIDGSVPLHHAVKARNHLSVMTLIRHAPCDMIFETDSKGRLPLHWAAEAGFTAALPYLADAGGKYWSEHEYQQESERESLLNGMRNSINAVDNFGDTALHHAARHGHEEFVAKLRLLRGDSLDLEIRNHDGLTALDLAKQNNHVWLVSALKQRVV